MFTQSKKAAPYKLSLNKQIFMNRDSWKKYGEYLEAKDLPSVVAHFEKKHNIKIIINGTTPFAQKFIQQNQQKQQLEINKLIDPNTKYVEFFERHWLYPGAMNDDRHHIGSLRHSRFFDVYDQIFAHIKPYLDEMGQLKKNLTSDQKLELNKVIASLRCKNIIDEDLESSIYEMEKIKQNVCLEKAQAIEEIKAIQKSLHSDEQVGYIFTNNTKTESEHFEVLIIQRETIIKPVQWNGEPNKSIHSHDFPQMQVASVQPLITVDHTIYKKVPLPQSTGIECGTLGLLYLKELLKENAKQMEEFTLSIPYYDDQDILRYLFFPSPQVLRYSQSSLFNKILVAALEPRDKDVELVHKDDKYKIKTLQNMLKETVRHPQATYKERSHANHALDELPFFRKQWLKDYKDIEAKRSLMDGDSCNFYLAYKSHHMQKLAHLEEEKADTQKLFLEP